MSERLAWRRSQINLNWRLRESQRHLTSSSHFKLMSRISSNTSLSHKQKIFFFARNKASSSSSLQIDEQNVGVLRANNLSPQFVWGWSVWKVYLHLETMLWVVAAHYILKRHQTHTRLFALQHRANPGGKRRRKKKKGYKFRKMSLCQQQSHSGSSLLRNDWGPNKPLTGLVLPGAGHGLSIWSCCLVVAE